MLRIALALVGGAVVSTHVLAAGGHAPPALNLAALTRRIPSRPADARSGSAFADSLAGLDSAGREKAILREILRGNVPSFLRRLVPVDLGVTIYVMPDYLAIGSDDDYLRMPMNLATAMAVADAFGFQLPTRKMVNAIYAQATYRLTPAPLPAGPRMTSTDYYRIHNDLIERQARAEGAVPGALVSGHKKDVVFTNLLARMPGRIAIYGWHRPTGVPIQPLSTVHGACYADYSHGIRLVAALALQGATLRPVAEILADRTLSNTLSDEGVIRPVAAPSACGIDRRLAN